METELQIAVGEWQKQKNKLYMSVNITFQSKSVYWLVLRLSELNDMMDVLSNKIEFIHYQRCLLQLSV